MGFRGRLLHFVHINSSNHEQLCPRPCPRVKDAGTLSVSVYKSLPRICGRKKLNKIESTA